MTTQKLTTYQQLEWFRLGKLAMTIVTGSVEAVRAFSALAFVKNRQRNRLWQEHMSACVLAFTQRWFELGTFPFAEALHA